MSRYPYSHTTCNENPIHIIIIIIIIIIIYYTKILQNEFVYNERYIYIYMYIYIYVYIYIFICNHENNVPSRLSPQWLCGNLLGGHTVFMIAYKLRSSCFCEIWALCVSLITYDHLYYAPCLVCWALFGSLVPAMCNRPSCAQVHESYFLFQWKKR